MKYTNPRATRHIYHEAGRLVAKITATTSSRTTNYDNTDYSADKHLNHTIDHNARQQTFANNSNNNSDHNPENSLNSLDHCATTSTTPSTTPKKRGWKGEGTGGRGKEERGCFSVDFGCSGACGRQGGQGTRGGKGRDAEAATQRVVRRWKGSWKRLPITSFLATFSQVPRYR